MPVILNPEDEDAWLNPDNQNVKELQSMLMPYTTELMEAFEVSDFVNSPGNQGPLCIKPVEDKSQRLSEEMTIPSGSA